MSDQRPEPDPGPATDYFAPPKESCECYCLHCQRVFMSDGIWFQKVINSADGFEGFWMCPTPNCDGKGFTFDIFPTNPDHPANAGWVYDDDDEFSDEFDDEDSDAEPGREYDPAEPAYAELDEAFGDDDDDIEGEEWKLGLAPGERPPDPPWVQAARREYEKEQARYEQPDERPRVLDWADRPPSRRQSSSSGNDAPNGGEGEIGESDIPF